MKRVLVTGGAGFVGSRLALGVKAWREGVEVVALDNLRRRGSELNLARLAAGGVGFVHGDIRSLDDVLGVGPVDIVIDCSAEPSVLAGYGQSPQYVVQTNLMGTLNCLELARVHGAGMIFISTSRVYPMAGIRALQYEELESRFELAAEQGVPGASPHGISEDFPLGGTRSLYGATKLASELMLAEYLEMYGLRGVVNRCGVISGPWQMGKVDQGVVVLWVARHLMGKPLRYVGYGGTGKQVRDVLHVDDLLDLVLYQLEHLDRLSGETFNVGGGHAVSASLLELTALCQRVTGCEVPLTSEAQDRAADIPYYISDHRRITERTGWHPRKGMEEIVEDISRWICDNREMLAPILE